MRSFGNVDQPHLALHLLGALPKPTWARDALDRVDTPAVAGMAPVVDLLGPTLPSARVACDCIHAHAPAAFVAHRAVRSQRSNSDQTASSSVLPSKIMWPST